MKANVYTELYEFRQKRDKQGVELTKEQLETLSDCILSKMEDVRHTLRFNSSDTLNRVIDLELNKLKNLNSIICNLLYEVTK